MRPGTCLSFVQNSVQTGHVSGPHGAPPRIGSSLAGPKEVADMTGLGRTVKSLWRVGGAEGGLAPIAEGLDVFGTVGPTRRRPPVLFSFGHGAHRRLSPLGPGG